MESGEKVPRNFSSRSFAARFRVSKREPAYKLIYYNSSSAPRIGGIRKKEISLRLRDELFSFALFPSVYSLSHIECASAIYCTAINSQNGPSTCTFEKLTDTFCLKFTPPSAMTLPNKNSTLADTISVELL